MSSGRNRRTTRGDEFRARWGAHDVRLHRTGLKHFHHPVVGTLDLAFDSTYLPGEDDEKLSLTAYPAEPGSPSQDAPTLLAGRAATTRGDSNQSSTDQRAI